MKGFGEGSCQAFFFGAPPWPWLEMQGIVNPTDSRMGFFSVHVFITIDSVLSLLVHILRDKTIHQDQEDRGTFGYAGGGGSELFSMG